MIRARSPLALLGSLVVVAALASACAPTTGDRAPAIAIQALKDLSPSPSPPPSPPGSRRCARIGADPRRSAAYTSTTLTPLATLPQPGHMPQGVLRRIQKLGFLKAGVDLNTLLLSYEDSRTGRFAGFEIDLLNDIAKAIFGDDRPGRIHYVAVTTAERITAVQDGTVDLVADAMTVTCDRMDEVDFSAQYFAAEQRILVPSNSTASNINDLKGKRICATEGSTSLVMIQQMGAVPVPRPTRIDCLVALQENLTDAITSDDTILAGFHAQDPFTKIIGPSLEPEPYGIAIAKDDPELVRFVNAVLKQMGENHEWRHLYAKWLQRYLPGEHQPTPIYRG